MLRIAATALGACLVASVAASQSPERLPPCDVVKIEKRSYCPKCRVFVADTEIERGRHMKSDTPIEQTDACVKTAFPCRMHGVRWVLHSRRCCPVNIQDCCVETTYLSKVEFKCDTCLRRGRTEDDVIHVDTDCPGAIVKTCERSGFYPHGGNPAPAFGAPRIPYRPARP